MAPKILVLILLCLAIAPRPGYCDSESSDDVDRAKLPELITELDLASLEAAEEDIEALKTVVKRLTPEKNGEYRVYQGVMGQPGVDFPALTTIPTTAFSCRGLKGGYYADLETNCQVFHICDNGRKISFLCPNGTIFQQSQLICDWWFKVDCSKSTELYEQSAEQLASEERKRSDAKRMNSEFHRSSSENDDNNKSELNKNTRNYYKSQNINYDGRQNGRTNPFGQPSAKNQIPGITGQRVEADLLKATTRTFDPSQIYVSNVASGNQLNQINDLTSSNGPKLIQQQKPNQHSSGRFSLDRGNYRNIERQPNQLLDGVKDGEKRGNHFNYEDQRGSGKFPGGNHQNSYNNQQQQQQQQNGRSNQQSLDYSSVNRNSGRDYDRRNFGKSNAGSFNYESSGNKVAVGATPSYTETTTFRTSTTPSPIREFQQLAESAAFASNRGNRFNEAYGSSRSNHYYNYNSNNGNNAKPLKEEQNQEPERPTEKPRPRLITSLPGREKSGPNIGKIPLDPSSVPFPTFRPIYKPRTTSNYQNAGRETTATTVGTTIPDVVTTTGYPYTENDNYSQLNRGRSRYNVGNEDTEYGTTISSRRTDEEFRTTTEMVTTESITEDYARNSVTPLSYDRNGGGTTNAELFFENTTPTVVTSGGLIDARDYATNRYSGFLANNPSITAGRSDSRFSVGKTATNTDRTVGTTRQGGVATVKTLSPYDTSFTYQQGKVMSTLGPYVPFTKNYAYSTTSSTSTTSSSRRSTTLKPPVYTATVPTYSSTSSVHRSSSPKSSSGKAGSSVLASSRPVSRMRSGSAGYLPEKKVEASTYYQKKHGLSERPSNEREHALGMLESLRNLEGDTVSKVLSATNGTRSGFNIPPSSGPSTLHSLALYFATASDDRDATAESRTDITSEAESSRVSGAETTEAPKAEDDSKVQLPITILTRHTIDSYAELFNLNNALEGNSSVENRLNNVGETDDPEGVSNEASDDLDIEQSEGPIDGAKKSNGTKLRQLAQVFTHALSAYLQDPETFKKILTEIRPTEPWTTSDEERFTATTFLPTTLEDYPSVTKEKDEVLDFSDDTIPPRNNTRPTTIYSVTTTELPAIATTDAQQDYYTTSGGTTDDRSGSGNNFAFQVNHAFAVNSDDANVATGNGVYYPEESSGLSGPSASGGLDLTGNSDPLVDYSDNYFPSDDSNANGRGDSRIGGFQNNTSTVGTYEPYGKNIERFGATPIGDNYVSSSTPATYYQNFQSDGNDGRYNEALGNPRPQSWYRMSQGATAKNSVGSYNSRKRISGGNRRIPTTEPFRIRYYDSTTTKPRNSGRETLVTAGSVYSTYRNNYNDYVDNLNKKKINGTTGTNGFTERPKILTSVVTSRTVESATGSSLSASEISTNSRNLNQRTDEKLNDHWTSSPVVTQLWESTIFVDPKRINQGLVSENGVTTLESDATFFTGTTERFSSTGGSFDDPTDSAEEGRRESLVTDATSSGLSSRNSNVNDNNRYPSSPWQWGSGNQNRSGGNFGNRDDRNDGNDSPTAFTLLPQTTYPIGERNIATGTPSPIYTTRSSITTTITSSVTSTSSGSGSSIGTGIKNSDGSSFGEIGAAGKPVGLLIPLPKPVGTLPAGPVKQFSVRPKHGIVREEGRILANDTDNEIMKAHNMFGKLNTTSTNALMKVMKQADTNVTVRQLVLLLINHCNGPMNKTMEEEKEQLLDALLRMPVNEFTSEESRQLVAGINRLDLPIGRNGYDSEKRSSSTTTSTTTTTTTTTSTTTEEPAVTTFRSKKGRRFKSNASDNKSTESVKNDTDRDIGTAETSFAQALEDTSASDSRALELLRSLYTIAAKWG